MAGKTQKKDKHIGTQLGDYKVSEILATGGMAKIYIGTDVNLHRKVAVKVLTPEMMEADSLLAERFVREARAVAALDHPNIIPIYQFGEQQGVYFLAMKLIQGQDLADEIYDLQSKGKSMSVMRMLHLLKHTAAALDHAHKNGVIHRDIKPSNILIERSSDRAILTDFGLVLRQTEIDKTMGTAFGTPRYISPEQALASEKSVPQSDIYSLAVIVFEILTGKQMFRADTAMQVALSHISEKPPAPTSINADIPKAVEREVLKALDKNPRKRHKTASAFIQAIEDAYDRAGVLQNEPTTPAADLPLPDSTLPVAMDTPAAMMPDEPTEATNPEKVPDAPASKRAARKERNRRQRAKKDQSVEKPRVPETVEVFAQQQTIPVSEPSMQKISARDLRKQRRKRRLIPRSVTLFLMILVAAGVLIVLTVPNLEERINDIADDISGPSSRSDNTATTAGRFEPIIQQVDLGSNAPVTAFYDRNVFVISNGGAAPVSLNGLRMLGVDDPQTFDATQVVNQQRLEPGECVVIASMETQVEISDEWGCESERNRILRWGTALFWRGTEGTFTVDVPRGDDITCDVTGSAEAVCDFSLPTILSS